MDLDNLTLKEIEAVAGRLETALKTIRDFQQIVGGQVFAQHTQPVTAPDLPPPTTNKGPISLSPAEIAQRNAILRGPNPAAMTPHEEIAMQNSRNQARDPLEGLRR